MMKDNTIAAPGIFPCATSRINPPRGAMRYGYCLKILLKNFVCFKNADYIHSVKMMLSTPFQNQNLLPSDIFLRKKYTHLLLYT